jgi:hypothetical protein
VICDNPLFARLSRSAAAERHGKAELETLFGSAYSIEIDAR